MKVNVSKLMLKILEAGFSVEEFAKELGINRATLYRKLADIEKFTIREVRKIKEILQLTNEEAILIFLS